MRLGSRNRRGKGALELIEEACHLLRRMPAAVVARYYAGSLPFVIAFLYFWSDMSRSAFAVSNAATGALLMAMLYLWMKSWQAVFCMQVRAVIAGSPPPRLTFAACLRLCMGQAALQPLSLLALPVALLVTLPFGWVYAFFHNLPALADGSTTSLRTLCSRAYRQAVLFPGQNHVVIVALCCFGCIVQLNVLMGLALLPQLIKMFTGIETPFTLAGSSLFNTTFFVITFGVTYLLMNPLVTTVYVLRCFYGESLRDGEDLRLELRAIASRRAAIVAMLIALPLAGSAAATAWAAPEAPPSAAATLSAAELDQALTRTLAHHEYAWQLPRQKEVIEEGPVSAFIQGIIDMVTGWTETVLSWIGDGLKWLFDNLFKGLSGGGLPSGGMDISPTTLYTILACLVALALIVVLIRMKLRAAPAALTGEIVPRAPDLADDGTTADELPADGWVALADKLMRDGDYRLGLRSLYMATLARLAQTGAITIARYKSNREYERELRRRTAASPELAAAFGANMHLFENTWYGMHEVLPDTVRTFTANHERIMALAEQR